MANRWILGGGFIALCAVILFPPWDQFHNGHPLIYNEEMGHHFLFKPPQATGENSWMLHAPATECQVKVDTRTLLWQFGMVAAIVGVLLFSLKRKTIESSQSASLTRGRLAMICALVALCLPMPPPDGRPTILYVIMAPISVFSDGGHVGPWAVLSWAGLGFGGYFVLLFVPSWSLVWLVRRRAQTFSESL